MKKLFSIDTPRGLRAEPRAPHYCLATAADVCAVLRSLENDIVLFNETGGVQTSFKFRDASSAHDSSANRKNSLKAHCLSFDSEGNIVVYDPLNRSIQRFSSSGLPISKTTIEFQASSVVAFGKEEWLVVGRFKEHLIHRVNLNGAVIESLMPETADCTMSIESQSFGHSACLGDKSIYLLSDPYAGIIDKRSIKGLRLVKRFVGTPRQENPIFQFPAIMGDSPYQELLSMSYPRALSMTFASVSTCKEGLIALLGSGRHAILFNGNMIPTRVLSFDKLLRQDPEESFASNIISIDQFGDRWIITTWSGNVWLLSHEELPAVPLSEALHRLHSPLMGHPQTRLGTIPSLDDSEVQRQREFLLGIPPGVHFTFDLDISKDGVVQAVKSVNPPTPKEENAAITTQIEKVGKGLSRVHFAPKLAGGERLGTKLQVQIYICDWTCHLASEAPEKSNSWPLPLL